MMNQSLEKDTKHSLYCAEKDNKFKEVWERFAVQEERMSFVDIKRFEMKTQLENCQSLVRTLVDKIREVESQNLEFQLQILQVFSYKNVDI